VHISCFYLKHKKLAENEAKSLQHLAQNTLESKSVEKCSSQWAAAVLHLLPCNKFTLPLRRFILRSYTEFYCSPTDGLDANPMLCQSGGRGLNTRHLLYVHREA